MKKLLLLSTLILSLVIGYSNNAHSMRIPIDVSVGYGTTYGGAGAKLTIGQILFGGVGTFSGKTMGNVGVQVPLFFSTEEKYKSTPYIGASYGGIGVQETTYGFESEKNVIMGYSLFIGYAWGWDFGLFIHGDVGYSRGKYTAFEDTSYEEEKTVSAAIINLGIGYRFY